MNCSVCVCMCVCVCVCAIQDFSLSIYISRISYYFSKKHF